MPDDPNHNKELDQLLDTALSTYAEHDEHLESRILAHLAAQTSAPKRRRWLPWAIALPIAACLVLLLTLYPRHNRTEPVQQAKNNPTLQTQPVPQNSIAQAPQAPAHQPQPRVIVARATRTAPAPPKLDVFPTPHPLSPEEQALVHFVTTTPESERNAVLTSQQQFNEPLHIAEVVIQPIASPDKPGTEPNR
jgi:hypothetical protein